MAASFGMEKSYTYTKEWLHLVKSSFNLAPEFAKFSYKISKLNNYANELETKIHKLDQHMLDNSSRWNSLPTIIPTTGWVTSYFGPRISPINNRLRMHEGIDIGAVSGTKIIAPADGVVVYVGTKPGFGKFVHLVHGYAIETFYAHAKKVTVKKGQAVKRGDTIAIIGNTGSSTGPHVHYEVRVNGTPVNPFYYILN